MITIYGVCSRKSQEMMCTSKYVQFKVVYGLCFNQGFLEDCLKVKSALIASCHDTLFNGSCYLLIPRIFAHFLYNITWCFRFNSQIHTPTLTHTHTNAPTTRLRDSFLSLLAKAATFFCLNFLFNFFKWTCKKANLQCHLRLDEFFLEVWII